MKLAVFAAFGTAGPVSIGERPGDCSRSRLARDCRTTARCHDARLGVRMVRMFRQSLMEAFDMNRHIASLGLAVALCSPLFACDKPGATEQQREDKASQQAEQARQEANQNAASAQANADKDIAAARTDFEKAREDYRHERYTDLADVDRKIADLDAQARTATGKVKADLDSHMPSVHAQRDAFARDMQSLDRSSGATWDSEKANLDKEWDDLKSAVQNAR